MDTFFFFFFLIQSIKLSCVKNHVIFHVLNLSCLQSELIILVYKVFLLTGFEEFISFQSIKNLNWYVFREHETIICQLQESAER
jgi:hypothetical protein